MGVNINGFVRFAELLHGEYVYLCIMFSVSLLEIE